MELILFLSLQRRAGKLNFLFQIDDDLTARINMGDAKFSFQEHGRLYQPAWMSPEALQRKRSDRNWEACDMWSFAICIWELATSLFICLRSLNVEN